jgi:putative membrane protein
MLSAQLSPLTAGTALSSWRLDPFAVVLAGGLGAGYLIAVRRVRAGNGRWSVPRSASFLLGGVGSLILITGSFLGVYAPVLRWVAVVQACLLLLVCPMLLGLGAPIALGQAAAASGAGAASRAASASGAGAASRAGAGREARGGRRAVAAVARMLWAAARGPGVGPLLLVLVMGLLVFTPWLGWSQQHAAVRALSVLILLAAGLILALPITDEGAQVSSLAYAAMLGLGLVEFLLDAVPGMVLRLSSHLLAAGYWVGVHRPWGPSALADQRLAGDWLWFFAEAGDLPFLLILIRAWIRSDARDAARQDAALDLLEAEAGGMMRPWWETEERNR